MNSVQELSKSMLVRCTEIDYSREIALPEPLKSKMKKLSLVQHASHNDLVTMSYCK